MSFAAERIRKGFKSVRDRLGFRSQRLTPKDLSRRQIEEEIPVSWKADNVLWGYVTNYMLKGSGAGFVTPLYVSVWETVWGVTPIEELPRYSLGCQKFSGLALMKHYLKP